MEGGNWTFWFCGSKSRVSTACRSVTARHTDASSNRIGSTLKKKRFVSEETGSEGSGELNRLQVHEERTTHTHFMVDSAATDGEATRTPSPL